MISSKTFKIFVVVAFVTLKIVLMFDYIYKININKI